MSVESGVIAPIVKEVTVPLPVARAWELFTSRVGKLVAVGQPLGGRRRCTSTAPSRDTPAAGCTRPREMAPSTPGARCSSGSHQRAWSFTWHPGRTPDSAQHLEVTFTPADDGRVTTVRLTHTGWHKLDKVGADERDRYDRGWDYVLGFFSEAANA